MHAHTRDTHADAMFKLRMQHDSHMLQLQAEQSSRQLASANSHDACKTVPSAKALLTTGIGRRA